MDKPACVIVSYNGSEQIEKTVNALSGQVDSIIIVDNGSDPDTQRALSGLAKESKIRIIRNDRNMGVARALNQGVAQAKEGGYAWVLTMDQDSVAEGDMVRNLVEGVEKFAGDGRTVSFAPSILYGPSAESPGAAETDRSKEGFEEKLVTITSGNLLSVGAFEKIGGFREELFVDSVDFDFCLRLKKSGYRIMRCNRAVLRHSLGERKEVRLFGRRMVFPEHPPRRKYYIVRNHVYVMRNYFFDFPAFCIRKQINLNGIVFRAFFLENDKRENARYVWRGFLDGVANRYGCPDSCGGSRESG
jgi:rhamnosyltransferase